MSTISIFDKAYPSLSESGNIVCHSRQYDLFIKLKQVRPEIWKEIIYLGIQQLCERTCISLYKREMKGPLSSEYLLLDTKFDFSNCKFEIYTRVQPTIEIELGVCYGNISVIILPE